jgi:hypothetical protein
MVRINRKVIQIVQIFMFFLLIAVYLIRPRFGAKNILTLISPAALRSG